LKTLFWPYGDATSARTATKLEIATAVPISAAAAIVRPWILIVTVNV